MELNSKYNMNETVWLIRQQKERVFILCKACSGTGKVKLGDDKNHGCPVCFSNKGRYEYLDLKWLVVQSLTIGQIQYTITNIKKDDIFDNIGTYADGYDEIEEGYMAYETGIKSGSRYYVKDLYSTEEEAQKECDKRNEEK